MYDTCRMLGGKFVRAISYGFGCCHWAMDRVKPKNDEFFPPDQKAKHEARYVEVGDDGEIMAVIDADR